MAKNFKIEGIYDQRTLKLLKQKGLSHFGFNFSPKSFNFIQEHVFLEQLIPLLDTNDVIHLHFSRSNDPMIGKVIFDLKRNGVNLQNVFIECDEWSSEEEGLGVNYYLNYFPELDVKKCQGIFFSGIIFEFSYLEKLHQDGVLNNFITNFYTRFSKVLTEEKKIILRIDWNNNIFPSLLDYFDFNLVSLSINSKIEICYRNVDLNKLKNEMDLLEKSTQQAQKF